MLILGDDKTLRYQCGVYKITCTATGEIYVGSTISPFKIRAWGHVNDLKAGRAPKMLQACYDEHGGDTFNFEPIEVTDPLDVRFAEGRWIERLSPALNQIGGPDAEVYAIAATLGTAVETIRQRKIAGTQMDRPIRAYGQCFEIKDECLTVKEISARYGVTEKLIRSRLDRGAHGLQLIRQRYTHV